MKNKKIMQAAPFEGNSTATAAGAGAEGGVVRDHDDSLSEGQLESIVGGLSADVGTVIYGDQLPQGTVGTYYIRTNWRTPYATGT